jgi:protein-L-isoaspartate(D-aspartate) O-methyltransferase
MSYESRRHRMISGQLQAQDSFSEEILDSFRKIPRELFVPESLKEVAYVEGALAISSKRRLMAPLMLARILKNVPLQKNHTIMIVGGGTGYSAALLSPFVETIFLVESEEALMSEAQKNLEALYVENVVLSLTALGEGLSQQAPFDFIFIEGGVSKVPDIFFHQLHPEKGMLVACLTSTPLKGDVTLFKRDEYTIHKEKIGDGYLPLLDGFSNMREFDF